MLKLKITRNKYKEKIGETNHNKTNCLMKIVAFYNYNDIVVEFQDKYKERVHTSYSAFKKGQVKNPYHPTVWGVGIVGKKYKISVNGRTIKEYKTWNDMLRRCFSNERFDDNNKHSVYKDVTCCEEWLLFENFYEWLHKQSNFNKWLNGERWAIDKDIIIKGNKFYSPETCCLVSSNINNLFTKNEGNRTNKDLPIGVRKYRYDDKYYKATCKNPFLDESEDLGIYNTIEEAFNAYKERKEELIKQVAENEFNQDNITRQCYEAMMKYEVEITD